MDESSDDKPSMSELAYYAKLAEGVRERLMSFDRKRDISESLAAPSSDEAPHVPQHTPRASLTSGVASQKLSHMDGYAPSSSASSSSASDSSSDDSSESYTPSVLEKMLSPSCFDTKMLLAFMMATHPRTGAVSFAKDLTVNILQMIAAYRMKTISFNSSPLESNFIGTLTRLDTKEIIWQKRLAELSDGFLFDVYVPFAPIALKIVNYQDQVAFDILLDKEQVCKLNRIHLADDKLSLFNHADESLGTYCSRLVSQDSDFGPDMGDPSGAF